MDSWSSTFGSSLPGASRIMSEASQFIARERAMPGYTSFICYVQSHDIHLIPQADIVIRDRIGSGAFMVVYKASSPRHLGNTSLAIKRINISLPEWESEVTRYTSELRGKADGESASVSGPPPPSIAPILVLEEASCTLKQLYDDIAHKARPKLSLDVKVSLWCDIANALSAVHLLGIIHGDLKPENILIFENFATDQLVTKLSDFGGCQPLPDEEGTGIDCGLRGTEYWNAPEVYDETNPYFRKPLRDYYSFGMVGAYIMFKEELNVGETLALVFGAKCWYDFLDLALGDVNIWTISASQQRKMIKADLRVLKPDAYTALPESLRKELMDQLEKKAQTSVGAEKAEYILSLSLWKVTRREITGEEFLAMLTEAARLGSLIAKGELNTFELTRPIEDQSFEERESNKWLLEYMLSGETDPTAFINKLQDGVPDLFSRTQLFEELRVELRLLSVEEGLSPASDDSLFMNALRAMADSDISRLRRIFTPHR
ncbi:kinase-like domain-containing protein [Aspergillus alliaceus]|uniref:Kinase-like domain-containing protein n=1 Tax=Petromyces alliaceus TaxID=209559 RepID=A0A5N7BZ31_PETAA|nr:kinase-like domain-containing protein [Aspergillus alliaceus]